MNGNDGKAEIDDQYYGHRDITCSCNIGYVSGSGFPLCNKCQDNTVDNRYYYASASSGTISDTSTDLTCALCN